MLISKCVPKSDKEKDRAEALYKLAQEFWKIPEIKQIGDRDALWMWDSMINTATKGRIENGESVPTVKELQVLHRIVNRDLKSMKNTPGVFAENLYLPKEIAKKIPATKKWFREVSDSTVEFKGNVEFFGNKMNQIFRILKEASYDVGTQSYLNRYNIGAKSKAQKQLESLYNSYNKLRKQGKDYEADRLYTEEIVEFVNNGEGQIFRHFHELASATESEFNSMRKSGDYSQKVKNAAEIWRNDIQPKGQELMIQGLVSYRNALRAAKPQLRDFTTAQGKNTYASTIEALDSMIKKFESQDLQKDGYFPVLSLDVMPTLAEASTSLFKSSIKDGKVVKKSESEFNEGADMIRDLQKVIDENIYINKHLKDADNPLKESGVPIDYNVIPIMDSFVRSAARFNYVAFNTGKYIQATKSLHEAYNKGEGALDSQITFLRQYMSDTYSMITGQKARDNGGADFTRAITSWQFASKLGLNIRGAIRNSTQSLLNWVHFGTTGIREVRSEMKDHSMQLRVNQGLKDNGILFPDIKEVYFEDFAPKVEFNERTGTYEQKLDSSVGEAIGTTISRIAEKMGKPMQWVENKINRRFTFQLGYVQQWKADMNRKEGLRARYNRKLKRRGKDIEAMKKEKATIFSEGDSNQYLQGFEHYLRARASRAGNEIVRSLHFDYSMPGKSKILTSKMGSVLGQFQHYGVNFYNLQRKIVRDGFDDVFTSQWGGEGAWRMYRLGLLYTTVYGIFSPLLNADIGNLVQNDTLERLDNYRNAFLSDDEEKRKRAFFGKGPAIGTIGGPFISDLVTIGNVAGLYEMDEDSWTAYLAGYEDMAHLSESEKYKEMIRTLNVQAGRFIYSTYPKWRNGSQVGTLLQDEAGLRPTKEVRARREMLGLGKEVQRKAPKTSVDEAILRSLELISKR